MSLDGSATANSKLQGKINLLNAIQGKSAYEIAVLYGYNGTEEEWVNSLPYRLNENTEFVFLGGNAKEATPINYFASEIPIDSEMSDTSPNPVQNKAIKQYVDNITTVHGNALTEHSQAIAENREDIVSQSHNLENINLRLSKENQVLLDLGDRGLTGQTISNIVNYSLVSIRIYENDNYSNFCNVLCLVEVDYKNNTFKICGETQTNILVAMGTIMLTNHSIVISGDLNANNGIVQNWAIARQTISSTENKITDIKSLDCADLKIIGIV